MRALYSIRCIPVVLFNHQWLHIHSYLTNHKQSHHKLSSQLQREKGIASAVVEICGRFGCVARDNAAGLYAIGGASCVGVVYSEAANGKEHVQDTVALLQIPQQNSTPHTNAKCASRAQSPQRCSGACMLMCRCKSVHRTASASSLRNNAAGVCSIYKSRTKLHGSKSNHAEPECQGNIRVYIYSSPPWT